MDNIVFEDNNAKECKTIVTGVNCNIYKVKDFFEEKGQIKVPIFQRGYVWNKPQVEKLFEDIESLSDTNKKHYLGEIIIMDEMIIDGQQRLTTLGLLLYALGMVEETQIYFIPGFKENIRAFNDLLQGSNFSTSDYNQLTMFNFILEKIKKVGKGNLKEQINNLLLNVVYLSGNEFDANVLYNSINTTGVSLREFELIKTILFNRETMDSQVAESLNDYLDSISSNEIDELFRYYIVIKTGKLSAFDEKSNKKESISNNYKKYINNEYGCFFGVEQLKQEFDELNKWFDQIKKIKNCNVCDECRDYVKWLISCQPEIIPLLTVIFSFEKTDENYIRIMEALIGRVLRVLLKGNKVKSFVFNRITNDIYVRGDISSDDLIELLRREEIFKEGPIEDYYYCNKIENNEGKLILGIYNYIKENKNILFNKNYQLEHIFDKTPSLEMINEFPNFNDWINKIGNMTILSKSTNAGDGHKTYIKKRNTYKTGDFFVTKEVFDDYGNIEIFAEEQVIERTNKIVEQLLERFK